jgi:hypothetical protein
MMTKRRAASWSGWVARLVEARGSVEAPGHADSFSIVCASAQQAE